MGKRYNALSDYFKKEYGKKMVKLAIDGGFTCPNRDGTLAKSGCIFCSEKGSGEFAGVVGSGYDPNQAYSIHDQIESQKKLLADKWKSTGYIAYFQNFTNTYASVDILSKLYDEALAFDGIEGLAIATRPDCLDDEKIELLKEYKQRGILWVELGLQTIHENSMNWLQTHYTLDQFHQTFMKLKSAGIPVVVHLILGLPDETHEDFMASVEYVSSLKPFGVKLHMLNILKDTALQQDYENRRFELLDLETYIDWVTDAIEILDESIVIHRITGDGAHDSVIAPLWIKNKRSVLNGIEKNLVRRKVSQGSKKSQDHSLLQNIT
ncbi:MAG: TIGR01212 family radical SAM protein [Clostridiales bacterium]|nr:TIGR01212 family radical SAM protein [Clostridiales bacterium]MCD4714723.1 TIGR01212 family radical SAM protein [Clostridiales bacterium]